MKIGILQADSVMEQFQPRHGDYPQMIDAILTQAARKIDVDIVCDTYNVVAGDYPEELDSCDGYVISGSRQSVYDPDEWITRLRRFVVDLYAAKVPMVGICFGHQLIADELGGRTEAATSGWGVGAHLYDIVDEHWCMAPAMSQYRVLVSHKDQVTVLPESARLLASSEFCPNAMFTIADHVFALQGHPEFLPGYSEDLMNMRRDMIGEEVYRAGIGSLEYDLQSVQVAQWIVHFLKGDQSV